ncbi:MULTISPECIES: potassium/proton antiporter [Providencia]|uniref:Potassium/proton antiporter n=2 Tax=Providencia alcalifaciens TaxID=126385 RepID=A0AAW9VCV5_9GAMM|nr:MULTISPECIES: potassium/proton antiporter [Providencia]ETT08177.1 transporter, CPA2 family [Providencia alcalifaciens F90-2004]EUC95561.1 transporter, CPA2 family [Providencia alcalifaciens PAL-2]EUD02627.1 transporter, CPA2 family [Providencia alcalifaciens RIMD 1656011]EUD07577.1 transporter, CPA2 family [Providencia alcalifaciens R90-1475]EUD10235.1 transporter, CPA2 family [Providencia alcalifaciens 205/92]
MPTIEQLILLSSILILLGIFSSKLSARLGLPMLVMFLFIGMLAGEDGLGRITFDNVNVSYAVGSLALALILFDGGLQTSVKSIKLVWKPAFTLATFGVLITAGITGLAAAYILGIPLLEGLLLGAIVGSTDAAAVFSLLRNAGIYLNERLQATLEIESATNDPMAIFLTVGLLQLLMNQQSSGSELILLFISQMGIGAIVGISVGWISIKIINKIKLLAAGLYPVLVAACGLFSFGVASNLDGSGFLSIFVTGVVIGNHSFVFQRNTFLFHDGLAWLSQIIMFVMLGLLVNPSSLLEVWQEGLLIALVLTFIARPLAVVPVLKLFRFTRNEITLISWVGLRGSVPIILAIFPFIYGLPGANLIFDVVFFVVLISATLQGSTLPYFARKLNLMQPPPLLPAATLDITAVDQIDADLVEYTLGEDCSAVGRRLSQLALPDQTVIAMITREKSVLPPRGSTILMANDHLFVVLKPQNRLFLERLFSEQTSTELTVMELPASGLSLKGTTRLNEIYESYGIQIEVDSDKTLNQFIHVNTENEPIQGDIIKLDNMQLKIDEMIGPRIVTVILEPIQAEQD